MAAASGWLGTCSPTPERDGIHTLKSAGRSTCYGKEMDTISRCHARSWRLGERCWRRHTGCGWRRRRAGRLRCGKRRVAAGEADPAATPAGARAVRNQSPPYSGPRVAAEPTVKEEPSRRAKGRQHPPGARCKCMFMEAKGRAGPPGGKCPPAPGAPGQEAAPGRAGRGAGPPSCAARGKWRRHAVGRRWSLRALSRSRRSGPCAAGGPAGPLGSAPITQSRPAASAAVMRVSRGNPRWRGGAARPHGR